jgi:hypothetical protein
VPAGTWDIQVNPGQASTKPVVHVELIYRTQGAGDQSLASGDSPPGAAFHLQPNLPAIGSACGDTLVLRIGVTSTSVAGSMYGFEGSNTEVTTP